MKRSGPWPGLKRVAGTEEPNYKESRLPAACSLPMFSSFSFFAFFDVKKRGFARKILEVLVCRMDRKKHVGFPFAQGCLNYKISTWNFRDFAKRR